MTELDAMEKMLQINETDMVDALRNGRCKDFGEYQRICGVLHGLGLAKMHIQDLRQRMERDEDE